MHHPRMRLISTGLTFLTLAFALRSAHADANVDKIKDEGMNRSQVMQTLSYLSDVIGPRLTGSPNLLRANNWTKDKLTEWGLKNGHLEAWGPFGRGWSLQRFSLQVVEPQDIPLIAFPKAWSPGWKGMMTGEVVYFDATDEAGLEKFKGKLKGAIVLSGTDRAIAAHFTADAKRYTDDQLTEMANSASRPRGGRQGGQPGGRPGGPGSPDFVQRMQFASKKAEFLKQEGAALIVEPSTRGEDGTIFVQSATVPGLPPIGRQGGNSVRGPVAAQPTADGAATAGAPAAGAAAGGGRGGQARRISAWSKDAPQIIPQVVIASEHFNRLVRMIQAGEKVKMSGELAVKFYDRDPMAYNTVAEIPGTDLKDEIVMLGGHMDSWHAGTGATDNGAGVAVCMEAVRILQACKLQPRRTIRIALWSGEEEGLLGSRAYVTEHFGSMSAPSPGEPNAPRTLNKKPEYDKLSGYFNLDNGTGKIRGVYCQSNAGVRPIFDEWLAPFKEMGAATTTIGNTGSTDHASFDAIGLPGFQFIQDTIDYDTRTHHSNMDVFDRIQADDLKEAAVILATFVYNTSMRDEKLPRKTATQ